MKQQRIVHKFVVTTSNILQQTSAIKLIFAL